ESKTSEPLLHAPCPSLLPTHTTTHPALEKNAGLAVTPGHPLFEPVPLLTFPEISQGVIQSDLNYSVILQWVTVMNPEPVLVWTLNGKLCGTGEMLFIRRLSWKQLGTYVCTATNSKEQLFSKPVTVMLP
ncbi:immunoglobulin superfamily member 23, partial [Daubentonia madagascariensis]